MQPTPKDKMVKTSPKKKEVAVVPSGTKILSRTEIDLIKTTIAKGSTDEELQLFISVCNRTGLDPFIRQVHMVKRWDSKLGKEVAVIQVGIDGFRAIAEDGGKYAGSDDAVFRDDGEFKTDKGQTVKHPGSATVAVYKLMGNGERYPFTATARWSEYYPGSKQGYMWNKMPYGQLGKCAEALALRKAFPKQLSGLYTPEEMDQSQPEPLEPGEEPAPKPDGLFEKAAGIIRTCADVAMLKDFKEKVQGSDKYDKKQKQELIELASQRIEDLTPAQPASAEPTN